MMREQPLIQRSEQLVHTLRNRPFRPQVQIEDNRPASLLQAKMVAQLKKIAETNPPAIKSITMSPHAFKHKGESETENALRAKSLDFNDTTLLPFIQTEKVRQDDDFYNIILGDNSKNSHKSIVLGYKADGTVVHLGDFGVEKTAQL